MIWLVFLLACVMCLAGGFLAGYGMEVSNASYLIFGILLSVSGTGLIAFALASWLMPLAI